MKEYSARSNSKHGESGRIGVLLTNLGTPDAPTKKALRPYLKEFLSDPRVIELPRFRWWLVLNLLILNTRPKKSAELYQKIWTKEGSPLLVITEKQAAKLERELQAQFGEQIIVEIGMGYGNPSIASALAALRERGMEKLLVLPLFPHYSGTTTASMFDAVTNALQKWRAIPEFRMVMNYHDEPGYITALARVTQELWDREGKPEKLVMSFHGIPLRYSQGGDPYFAQCHKTGRMLAEALDLGTDHYIISFQSLFGKEEWLRPYTDETLRQLAASGTKAVDVICPGFLGDCLETLEEIDGLNRELFLHAGGERFRYIPCLNDRNDLIQCLAQLVVRHTQGWEVAGNTSTEKESLRANQSRFR